MTVTGSVASSIENFAGSTLGSNGVHLGQNTAANQSITFNVADVTGNANADLTVAPALLNTSSSLTASGLTKSGAGTMLLTGLNTYTGATVISGGILQVGNGNGATLGAGNYAGAISGSGTLAFNSTAAQSLAGGITGSTILTKDGSGALTISGTSALGAVTLTNGTLNVNGTTSAGTTSVAGGTTLGAKMTAAGTSVLTLGSSSLTFGASTLAIDFNSLNPTVPVINMSTGTLTLNGTLTPTFSGTSALANGAYTLIDYGTVAGAGSFTGTPISLGARSSGTVSNDTGNTNIILTVSTDKPVWTGVNGSSMVEYAVSTATTGTPNFALLNAHTATDFWTGDDVQFNDTYNLGAGNVAVANSTVTINTGGAVNAAGVAASSITFNNSAIDYTVNGTGAITSGSVVKNGSGKVTLTTANTYTGGTTINGGTIAINTATSLGAAAGALTLNNGTLQTTADITSARNIILGHANSTILTDTGTTYTVSGLVSGGSGALIKTGNGTLTLSTSTNTFGGGLFINAGNVSVDSNVRLGGASGTTGAITINGGTLVTTAGFTNTHAITIDGGGGTINVTTTGQLFMDTPNTLLGSGTLNVIGGNGTLVAGTGNLRVAQTNTFDGAINISTGGIFEYGVAGAVAGASTFNIGNQGELAIQTGVSLPNAVTVSGGTNSVLSFENGTTGNLTGSLTLNANAIVGLRDWYNNATVRGGTISGQITGNGSLTVNSGSGTGGVLTLSNVSNNYSGGTTISGATLNINADAALGTAPVSPAPNLTFSGNGSLQQASATSALSLNANRNIVINTGATATFNANGASNVMTLNGAVSNQTNTGIFALATSGANAASGTVVLAGINDFATGSTINLGGGTNLGGGILRLANSSALGLNAVTINGAGGNSNWVGAVELSGGITIGSNVTLNIAGHNQGGVGADNLRNFSGSNTFNGAINITQTGGAYQIDSAEAVSTLYLGGNISNTLTSSRTLNFIGDGNTEASGVLAETGAAGTLLVVAKSGAGTLTLSNTNTYTGATTISGGTLSVGTLADIGVNSGIGKGNSTSGATNAASLVFDGGTLKYTGATVVTDRAFTINAGKTATIDTGANNVTFTGATAAATNGALTKIGTGALTLGGTNTYTGATMINEGKLLVNGSLASTTTTVANGATLGGNGSLAGTTTIQNGGFHAVGNSVDDQTFTNLTYADGSIFSWEINRAATQTRGTGYDAVNVSGTLTGSDGADDNSTFDAVFRVVIGDATFSDAFWTSTHTWSDIFTTDGSTPVSGWTDIFGGGIKTYTAGGVEITDTATYGSFSFTPDTNSLRWSAVPEPTSALAGLLLGAGLLRRRRKG